MYAAFPRSEYYGSSDFSSAVIKALLVILGFELHQSTDEVGG